MGRLQKVAGNPEKLEFPLLVAGPFGSVYQVMCRGGATMACFLTYRFLLQVILYQGGQMFDGAPRFHGRVGFTGTMPATNVSIFINNTQLSDTGTYQCLVNNLPDRGGRNIGVAGLTVLGECDRQVRLP